MKLSRSRDLRINRQFFFKKEKNTNKFPANNKEKRLNIFIKPSVHTKATSRMKRSLSEDENCSENTDSTSVKKAKIDSAEYSMKNSVQIIYEIKPIQPIKFELLMVDGPSHKPVFKFKLSIKDEQMNSFISEANSMKNARKLVAIKCLYYLVKSNKIPSLNSAYVQTVLETDFKTFNFNMTIEEFFSPAPKQLEINSTEIDHLYEAVDLIKSEKEDWSIPMIPIESGEQKSNRIIDAVQSFESHRVKLENKTREVIATKNVLSILNHMLQTVEHSFNELEEIKQANGHLFKIELAIKKSDKLNSKLIDFGECMKNFNPTQSKLMFECEEWYRFHGIGNNKKSAKLRSAQLALENIFDIKINNEEAKKSESLEATLATSPEIKLFADNVSELVKEKYYILLNQLECKIQNKQINENLIDEDFELTSQNKLRSVYAGIVQSNDFDSNSNKLVCVTTGTKCISGEYMSQTGYSINDCHAEILAIRLLRKYLYKELNICMTSTDDTELSQCIFERVLPTDSTNINLSKLKPFRVKKNIKFNLFISSAPCGDGRIFSVADCQNEESSYADKHPNRKVRGLLRAKLESGEGTVPCNNLDSLQTWDAILAGDRLKVMSCSDKLCKFNAIGLQGALLSHFIETIYLDSIIIGGFFHKNHLSRAMYGRLFNNLSSLPEGYHINKPQLSTITNNLIRQVSKSSNKAILWSNELGEEIEILSCKTGQTINGSKSFVCKSEMFKCWLSTSNILKKANECSVSKTDLNNEEHILDENEITYNQVKIAATEYQKAKLKVYEAFRKSNLGEWISKPFEQNCFTHSASDN